MAAAQDIDGVDCVVPLEIQCYTFIVGHLDKLPSDVIALLQIRIRRKLLLMLPALDICKLEETPVTDGTCISMDEEIWKWKCNERKVSIEDITLTWKDSYFCNVTVTNCYYCLICIKLTLFLIVTTIIASVNY